MLKARIYNVSNNLSNRPVAILLTNSCHNNCGNCNQFCNILKQKKQQWAISLEQFEQNINILSHKNCLNRQIILTGGEPTTHPKWNAILDLVASSKKKFVLFTTKNILLPINVSIRNDIKSNQTKFVANLISPVDVLKNSNKLSYWYLSQKYCWVWSKNNWFGCATLIYDNKAFICCPGAAIERLKYGVNNWNNSCGWKIELGKDPFNRSDIEIESQAVNLCYRCGICLKEKIWHTIDSPTIVSNINKDLIGQELNDVKIE